MSKAIVVLLVLFAGIAHADRKRLAVLDFEGDDAEELQKSFVKFLKKSHTVIKADKWNSAAEELGATKVNEKNVKKVAKKLKIDGIITANVEKRRDEYIIRIKLRSGSSGNLVGNQVNLKTDAPKLNKTAKGDLEDELFGQISNLPSVRGGGGEEEAEEEDKPAKEDKPSKFGGKQMKGEEEEEEEKPAKLSKKDEEKRKKEEEAARKEEEKQRKEEEEKRKKEEAAAKKKQKEEEEKAAALVTKKSKDDAEEEEEEEERPKKKSKKKKVAASEEEEEEGVEEEAELRGKMDRATALSPSNRAVDVVVGLSINVRRLSFSYDPTIGIRPAGYKGGPVPGAMLDLTVYPLAFGHKDQGQLKNIGATAFFDQVLLVKSEDMTGKELQSAQARYAIGVVYRYPFSNSASSPVVGGRLRAGKQQFKISQPAPLPNVNYTIIDPGLFFRMPIGNKLILDANASFLLVPNTGQIQNQDKYGAATVTGFEVGVGADYMLFGGLFVRSLFGYETIRYSFKGNGQLTDMGKVKSAADTYYGMFFNIGYLL